MAYPNILENWASAVQAELRKSIIQTKNQEARHLNSFKSGAGAARTEQGALAGLEIPFKKGVPHGEAALDPIRGDTSFERMQAPPVDKMYCGLAFMAFTVEWEHFHEQDASRGKLPETRFDLRDQVMMTYYQHQNFYSIGPGSGELTFVSVGGGSGLITFTNDNTGPGRSKGSLRLAVSNFTSVGKRIEYQSVTKSTGTITATFYVTSVPSVLTANVVITDGGTIVAGDAIVKKGHYNRVPRGRQYLIDYAARDFQGVSTAVETQFNARRVNAGGGDLTPTQMDTAKGAAQTRGNSLEAKKKRVCHQTFGNYRRLGAFGYDLRQYNAEKGDANTTFALPDVFEDEDLIFLLDANDDDSQTVIRNRTSYFYYRQTEMQKISKGDGTQWVGINLVGSTEFQDNYGESFNMCWDARGEDGKMKGDGHPNDAVVIDNYTLPEISQISEGQNLMS